MILEALGHLLEIFTCSQPNEKALHTTMQIVSFHLGLTRTDKLTISVLY